MPPLPFLLAAFLVGLLFGSFLNVCISRLPLGETVVRGRSLCRGCAAMIRWYDNIPLLSWILLRRRCRDCGAAISWRYPAVELSYGLWVTFALQRSWQSFASTSAPSQASGPAFTLSLLSLSILGFLLIGLMVMDWQSGLLPDAFTLSGVFLGFLLTCFHAAFLAPGEGEIHLRRRVNLNAAGSGRSTGNLFITGPEATVLGRIAAIAGVVLLLLTIRWIYKRLRHQEGMGLGDVKMLAMIAAFLGWWPAILAFFAGTVLATAYAVVLLLRGRGQGDTALRFGTFLGAGGLLSAVWNSDLIGWYSSLFR